MSGRLDSGDSGVSGSSSVIKVVDIGLNVGPNSAVSTVDVNNSDDSSDYDVTVSFTATSGGVEIVSTEQTMRVGPNSTRAMDFTMEHTIRGGGSIEACASVVDIEPVGGL